MPTKPKTKSADKQDTAVDKAKAKTQEEAKSSDKGEENLNKETPTTEEKMTDGEPSDKPKEDKPDSDDNEETKEPAEEDAKSTAKEDTEKKAISESEQQIPSLLKDIVCKFLASKEQEAVSEEFKKYRKEALVLEIYETFPLFLVHDGFFFLNVAFSKEAWATLKQQVSDKKMKLSDMPMYRLAIENFKLQLRKVKASQQIFTSYGTLEVRLLITKAEITEERLKTKKNYPEERNFNRQVYVRSLFRDEEVRTLILSRFHKEITTFAKTIELPAKSFKGESVHY